MEGVTEAMVQDRARWALSHLIGSIASSVDEAGTLFVTLSYGSCRRPLTTEVELRSDWTISCGCHDYAVHRGALLCKHCWFVLLTCFKVSSTTPRPRTPIGHLSATCRPHVGNSAHHRRTDRSAVHEHRLAGADGPGRGLPDLPGPVLRSPFAVRVLHVRPRLPPPVHRALAGGSRPVSHLSRLHRHAASVRPAGHAAGRLAE